MRSRMRAATAAGHPGDVDQNTIPTLDPNDECASRQGIVGQLQPGVGAARRGAQAARRRRVREGQRGGTELIRAALAGFAAGGSIGRREDFAERSPGTLLPFPLAPERIRLRRLSSRACAYYSRVTSVTPSCTSQGDVTPILIGVESVPYRTRYSVDSSYLF